MTTQTNEYENAEVVAVGTARDIILGEKNFPMFDQFLAWPLFYTTDPFQLCDDVDLAD